MPVCFLGFPFLRKALFFGEAVLGGWLVSRLGGAHLFGEGIRRNIDAGNYIGKRCASNRQAGGG
jgi:hypothetical protein